MPRQLVIILLTYGVRIDHIRVCVSWHAHPIGQWEVVGAHIPQHTCHHMTSPQHDGDQEAESGADGVCIDLRFLQGQGFAAKLYTDAWNICTGSMASKAASAENRLFKRANSDCMPSRQLAGFGDKTCLGKAAHAGAERKACMSLQRCSYWRTTNQEICPCMEPAYSLPAFGTRSHPLVAAAALESLQVQLKWYKLALYRLA